MKNMGEFFTNDNWEEREGEKIIFYEDGAMVIAEEYAKEVALDILYVLGYRVALTEIAKEIGPKRCPFCKGENLRMSHDGILNLDHVECNDCGMSGPLVVGRERAITHWNNISIRREK